MIEKIMDYESGNMTDEETVEFFQELIDTGMVYKLQGTYGRTAEMLINAGHCHIR